MKKHTAEYGAARSLAILLALALVAGAATAQDPAADFAPTVQIDLDGLTAQEPKSVATTFTVGVLGADPDAADGRPVSWRYLYRPAQAPDGSWITTRVQYEMHAETLVDWGEDAVWSSWMPYQADPALNRFTFPDQEVDSYFLFAAQVMDADGTVSLGRGYQEEVAHLHIVDGLKPDVVLCEFHMGCSTAAASFHDIAGGQPLNLAWIADASGYGGTIVSYRHGWDLADPGDPNDPGWAVPPGLAEQNLFAAERIFQDGIHSFTLQVTDNADNVSVVQATYSVVPFVPYNAQQELLFVDQVHDSNVNNWLDQGGQPRNDESFRNAYWQFLVAGPGGVEGFSWEQDRFDHTERPTFADLVGYKAVLCNARYHPDQTLFQELRPGVGTDLEGNPERQLPYNWLEPYQQRGGNLFLVGDRSMESVLESNPRYMTPMVFTSPEDDYVGGNWTFSVGFGDITVPGGTEERLGPMLYPYATAGIALLDWTSSASKYIYARPQATAAQQRRVDCVGLKGLLMDPDFKTQHGVSAMDVADTIMTDEIIDWHDDALYGTDRLAIVTNQFPFRDDEFVDGNITTRTTDWAPQACDDPAAPGGLCVEPMFRGMARFDWLRDFWRGHGEPDWPSYSALELDDTCGVMALASYDTGTEILPRGTARTNGQVFGYLSYKQTADKPSGKADVYWGFDPYRFDNEQTKDAVRWVLRYFQLNVVE